MFVSRWSLLDEPTLLSIGVAGIRQLLLQRGFDVRCDSPHQSLDDSSLSDDFLNVFTRSDDFFSGINPTDSYVESDLFLKDVT